VSALGDVIGPASPIEPAVTDRVRGTNLAAYPTARDGIGAATVAVTRGPGFGVARDQVDASHALRGAITCLD